MSIHELYPNEHEFDIKLDLKRALMSIVNDKSVSKNRETRIKILYVLIQRYWYNRTLDSISKDLGTRREWIRQLEARGFRYLKHPKHNLHTM